jgi:exonuclease SbcC
MLPLEISFRGIVDQFLAATPTRINFAELGELTAFVGKNGAGKTSALAVVCIALYKVFPSRPGFYENFEGRDAFVEAILDDNGHRVRVLLEIDAEKRTCENYIEVDGKPIQDQKLSAIQFKAEIEKRFGSKELFLAGPFMAQNRSGSILEMSRAERKQLIGEMIGLGPIQDLHKASAQVASLASGSLAAARNALAAAEAEIGDLEAEETRLVEAQDLVEITAGALETARTQEADSLSLLERARSAGERIAALLAAHDSARATHVAANAAVSKAQNLVGTANAQAVRRLHDLAARRVEELEPNARDRHTEAIRTLQQRRIRLEALVAEKADVAAAATELAALLQEREQITEADRAYESLNSRVQLKTRELTDAQRRLADARANQEREKARLKRQTELLGQVPCAVTEEWFRTENAESVGAIQADLAGTCPLLADARRAQSLLADLEAVPGLDTMIDEVEALVGELGDLQVDLQADLSQAQVRGRRKVEINKTESILRAKASRSSLVDQAEREVDLLDIEQSQIDQRLAQELEAAATAVDQAERDREEIEREKEAAIEECALQIETASAACDEAAEKFSLAAAALQAAISEGLDVAAAEASARRMKQARESAELALRASDRSLMELQTRIEAMRARRDSLDPLRADISTAAEEVGDWNLIEEALGPNGVQALELDAAGPHIAALSNELLNSFDGPRFSISFPTLAPKVNAPGEYKEVFDINVRKQVRECKVESLSGGEQVLVSEVISLGISIFNARKSGVRWEMMFRDETTGPLDEENAPRYVLALRRARELGGYKKIVFVSHNRDVWQMADVRLFFEGQGRITLDGAALAA